jgi:hypothetical protein
MHTCTYNGLYIFGDKKFEKRKDMRELKEENNKRYFS